MEFVDFVNRCPTPYHTVATTVEELEAQGFTRLRERESWDLASGGKHYVTRNGSSIIAFQLGNQWVPGSPMAIVGAHTDSPTLRLKPRSAVRKNGYVELGVETYGGGLWPTWFDRDLSVAGRIYVNNSGISQMRLLKIDKPLLRIPTLAIHLHREQSDRLEFNKEEHLKPIMALCGDEQVDEEHHLGLMNLVAEELGCQVSDILDFELVLYDTQKAVIGGLADEFVFSPRLDNLNSCFCATRGLLQQSQESSSTAKIVALFDHEEIGSVSAQGAESNFLSSVCERLNVSKLAQSVAQSFLLSADMAHAGHPNYEKKYEKEHQPRINAGPVIKTNANQRYATNAFGNVLLGKTAQLAGVPLQKFVVRNDSPCGSTIGPMIAANLGIQTLDIGNPQLSMHSIRETGGTKDIEYAIKLYNAFFTHFEEIEKSIELD